MFKFILEELLEGFKERSSEELLEGVLPWLLEGLFPLLLAPVDKLQISLFILELKVLLELFKLGLELFKNNKL